MNESEITLYTLILFFALYWFLWAYTVWRTMNRPPAVRPLQAQIDFRFPDRVSVEYLDAAGNVVANRWYVMEKPGNEP